MYSYVGVETLLIFVFSDSLAAHVFGTENIVCSYVGPGANLVSISLLRNFLSPFRLLDKIEAL